MSLAQQWQQWLQTASSSSTAQSSAQDTLPLASECLRLIEQNTDIAYALPQLPDCGHHAKRMLLLHVIAILRLGQSLNWHKVLVQDVLSALIIQYRHAQPVLCALFEQRPLTEQAKHCLKGCAIAGLNNTTFKQLAQLSIGHYCQLNAIPKMTRQVAVLKAVIACGQIAFANTVGKPIQKRLSLIAQTPGCNDILHGLLEQCEPLQPGTRLLYQGATIRLISFRANRWLSLAENGQYEWIEIAKQPDPIESQGNWDTLKAWDLPTPFESIDTVCQLFSQKSLYPTAHLVRIQQQLSDGEPDISELAKILDEDPPSADFLRESASLYNRLNIEAGNLRQALMSHGFERAMTVLKRQVFSTRLTQSYFPALPTLQCWTAVRCDFGRLIAQRSKLSLLPEQVISLCYFASAGLYTHPVIKRLAKLPISARLSGSMEEWVDIPQPEKLAHYTLELAKRWQLPQSHQQAIQQHCQPLDTTASSNQQLTAMLNLSLILTKLIYRPAKLAWSDKQRKCYLTDLDTLELSEKDVDEILWECVEQQSCVCPI